MSNISCDESGRNSGATVSTEALLQSAPQACTDTCSNGTGSPVRSSDPIREFDSNQRVSSFIKSYLGFLSWSQIRYAFIQSQTYWILGNWLMFDLTGNAQFEKVALQGTEFVCEKQRPEGYWEYPNPEWKNRIATVEGCVGTLGMLEGYRRTDQRSS